MKGQLRCGMKDQSLTEVIVDQSLALPGSAKYRMVWYGMGVTLNYLQIEIIHKKNLISLLILQGAW